MKNVSDKAVEINKNTFYVPRPFFENCAVYEKKWNHIVELDRPQVTIWHTRNAYSITKSTHTHTEYCFSTAKIQGYRKRWTGFETAIT